MDDHDQKTQQEIATTVDCLRSGYQSLLEQWEDRNAPITGNLHDINGAMKSVDLIA